jgi:hypothetical protein
MDKSFYTFWFKGFVEALGTFDNGQLETLARSCGKACASSYTREVYKEENQKSGNLVELVGRIVKRFPETEIAIKDNGLLYVTYKKCMCPLFTDGFVTNGRLCICSAENLKGNWEVIFGKGNIEVEMLGTIQLGDKECRFKVIHK